MDPYRINGSIYTSGPNGSHGPPHGLMGLGIARTGQAGRLAGERSGGQAVVQGGPEDRSCQQEALGCFGAETTIKALKHL